jgi:phosphatidylinositol glycan class B
MLACLACILRPTNALIWFAILMPVVIRTFSSSTRLQSSDYLILLREAVLVGSAVLILSVTSDRLYFGEWTFPPYQFLYFNINQNLAVFYGKNDFHYYLSQGLPLLLTTFLPFGLAGIWKASSLPSSDVRFHLLTAILFSIGSLSLISHKEVRFIYPLLPLLHILAAPSLASFFTATELSFTKPIASSATAAPKVRETRTMKIIRKPHLATLIALSVIVSFYTATRHQRAPTTILSTLRHAYETEFLDAHGAVKSSAPPSQPFVAFLTPCHSTPWRSQLTYPSLSAWALTCSPPLTIPPNTPERAAYRDEADRFYDNMTLFLDTEVGVAGREWPSRYIVGFEGIEDGLSGWVKEKMKGKALREKWRVGNSDWHDDWRRVGDMVVWEFVDRE